MQLCFHLLQLQSQLVAMPFAMPYVQLQTYPGQFAGMPVYVKMYDLAKQPNLAETFVNELACLQKLWDLQVSSRLHQRIYQHVHNLEQSSETQEKQAMSQSCSPEIRPGFLISHSTAGICNPYFDGDGSHYWWPGLLCFWMQGKH